MVSRLLLPRSTRQIVRVAIFPIRRIARRPKLIRAENPPILPGTRHAKNQSQMCPRSLEIRNPNTMDSALQIDAALFVLDGMYAVVIDHRLVVYIQLRPVVGA